MTVPLAIAFWSPLPGQCVPVRMAPHSARSQGPKSPPGRVHRQKPNQCGPPPAADQVQPWPSRPGLADAQT